MFDADYIIFDLDGTLIDLLPGIQFSAERAAAAVMPECAVPDLRRFLGPPIREVLAAALGSAAWGRESALEQAYKSHFDCEGWKRSVCLPGIAALLAALESRGKSCFVVTSERLLHATRILARQGLMAHLKDIITLDSRTPVLEDKTGALNYLLQAHDIPADRAILVSNCDEDALAAQSCGMAFVSATAVHQMSRPLEADRSAVQHTS